MKSLYVASFTVLAVWWSAAPAAAAFLVADYSSTTFNQTSTGHFDQPSGYQFTIGSTDLVEIAIGDWVSRANGRTSPIFVALSNTVTVTPLEDLQSGPAAFSPDITSSAGDSSSPLSPQMPTNLIRFSPTQARKSTPSPDVTAVPAPSGLLLSGIGSLGLLGYGWRRRRSAS
jgi:hypothetical protein